MSGTGPDERGSFLDALKRRTVSSDLQPPVPPGLRQATAYAWRLLVIAAALAVVIFVVIQLKLLVIPLLVAVLISALVWPGFSFLLRHRWPKWLAIIVTVLGTLAIIAGLVWVAVWQISRQFGSVRKQTEASVQQFREYLISGPLHLSAQQIDDGLTRAGTFLQQQGEVIWTGALTIGSTIGHVATGVLLTLFILLCLLADGGGIWRWTTRLFPRAARPAVDGAGRAGWRTIKSYARTQLLVATIDAIGIGLGAFLLGVPLSIPIGVLVFLGAFIPFVGAVATGALAVFIALVYNGPLIALFMLIVVLGVQQFESHVLHPILMGSAVKVHPLAVVLVVAGGAMIGGIAGALFAVPLAAFVNVVAVYLSTKAWKRDGETLASPDLIWRTVPRERGRRS
ncbi:putative PurR-regulated permease PerM [Microbacterium testaceum]|uniref:AI-2E family transporter n=1 Tax=Microbacterium TaxID=33882 RepID=UPI001AEBA2DA|nr:MULTISPECIES: AI-2E family transporter [Microbacterium]MDQ1110863.1 putative PurR-regulated permease PerM [Microbacterium testaceum]MDQ1178362.1 putative PurR-regulated permease PerM [Microbacterium sp. SORGH_AS_0421]MDR6098594.1 putative PurR-regulated permease PerM [Microbacterium sp. SORGH_AS_0454]WAC68383.1 AI-2E family transporter [Microbacterium sp. SL75]